MEDHSAAAAAVVVVQAVVVGCVEGAELPAFAVVVVVVAAAFAEEVQIGVAATPAAVVGCTRRTW